MHQAGGLVKDILDELESELLQDLLRSTKPVQQPYPPVIVGGFRLAARRATRYGDGILPAAPSAGSGSPEDFMPRFRKMAEGAGRDPASLSVTLGGAPEDLAVLRRNSDLGLPA